MRLMRISLAAKYRFLFGLAVLLIIGAALCVPGYRMAALVLAQPYHEAQRLADDYFRIVMPDPEAGARLSGGVHAEGFGKTAPTGEEGPHFVPRPRRMRPDATEAELDPDLDPFVAAAFWKFLRQANRQTYHVMREQPEGRRFRYARAVRVTKRCLDCHGEGKTARSVYRENELAGVILVDLPAELSHQGLIWNWLIIGAAGALAGVLAILVFYVITHRFILSPIEELRGVAGRVADGDLTVRSGLQTGDEFEQLADSLNTMLERLRESQEDLRKANRLLDQKLGDLAETNVALFEANRVKSEFIANVSHELRTPMTSIIGFAELLREGPQAEQDARTARYAENILISGRILLEIINDLLDLAKIEAGKVELKVEPVRIDELCDTLADFVRPQSEQNQLTLTCEHSADLPTVQTDHGRVRQVLFNLLSNAIKFTPAGGKITLRTTAVAPDRVRIDVSDTGPGIDPEYHEVIFEKFRQIDQSATREHHGAGLGLAISREFAVLLGGRLWVESELGQGATFSLELPTDPPQPPTRREVTLV